MIRSLLTGTVRSLTEAVTTAPAGLTALARLLTTHAARMWETPGGVQIEVRNLGRPGTAQASRDLETGLVGVPGVHRAEVNGTLGCVYVGCDPAETDLEGVDALVSDADAHAGAEAAGAEAADEERRPAAGADAERAPRAVGYPGAPRAAIGAAVQLGASVVAFGVAVVGRTIGIRGLPPALSAAVQLAEATPRVREGVARRVGAAAAETGWAAANLLTTTLMWRPLGVAVATALAWARYAEVQARRRAWHDWAQRLASREGAYRHDAAPAYERPAPLPPGPGDRYANVAVPAALAAYGLTAAGTLSHDRGLALLISATPRGPRFGRESFACAVAQTASRRGALILRPEALRRLDRIDTVVLDARVLATGTWTVGTLIRLQPPGEQPEAAAAGTAGIGEAGVPDVDEIHAWIHELMDDADPSQPQERSGWALRPYATGDTGAPSAELPEEATQLPGRAAELPGEAAASARQWAEEGARVLLVLRHGRPVAVAGLVPQLHPLAEHLVQAARACGRVVLVGGVPGLHRRFGLDEAVPTGGTRTAALVRSLQEEGHGVAVVTTRTRRALGRADLGIGVTTGARQVPWDADIAAPPDVAHLLLSAIPEARRLSRLCARLEAAGALVGATVALAVPRRGAWARARLVADSVTIAGLVAGTWAGWRLRGRPAPVGVERTPWHAMTVRQVMVRLGTSSRGLDHAEAARRRQLEGTERPADAVTLIARVAEELANPLTPILAIGGGISAALGSVVDAVLIGGVLGVDALVGGAQRVGADRAAGRLLEATSARARLRRAGRPGVIDTPADQLVRGDVIELLAGDAVPADCRVVHATGLEVDESSLTGESQPVVKTAAPTAARAVADRTSMLYQGTTVAAGSALAVVVATGAATEAGSAAEAAPAAGAPESGVERRLNALGRWFLPLSIASGVVLFLSDISRMRPLGAALGNAVSLCVAAVPEALPFVATVAELAAARRLSGRNTLVRSAPTIEALGRTDVLCFDKTGTLTEGRISLRQVSDGLERRPPEQLTPALRRVVATAVLAGPAGPAATLTHPTDRAIAAGAELLGTTPVLAAGMPSAIWERVAELPFEPGRGYHAVLGRTGTQARIVVKGAPEVVLARCERIRRNDSAEPFDDRLRAWTDEEIERHARRGLRVLAVAERILPAESGRNESALVDEDVDGLCLLGLLGLADPVRATAAESVNRLAAAGVRIVMLTGDHPSTAAAIAGELQPDAELRMMTGAELEALDDDALARTLPDVAVFARVTPAHKVRIVTALRAAGRVVAVTGDGANDAPAIRIADVGIAIGSRAMPAARAAADVVVTDDRIETIVDAIVEGRAMWGSVRKALGILLGGNLGEIAFTLATSLLTGRSALNARQLLLVNLLTDMLPAMAIAARPPAGRAERLLAEGPEASLGKALTRHIRLRATNTAAAAGTAWIIARMTGTRARADTVSLVALVASQLLQTLADAGRDPVVAAAAAGSLAVLVLVVAVPGLSQFFGSRPLGPAGWTIGLAAAAGSVLLPAAWHRLAAAGPQARVTAGGGRPRYEADGRASAHLIPSQRASSEQRPV
ncbi:cation-translocating P-type ATPase [Streptomyces jeddahensis]|uniref:Calcium-transporting ATPase 1 n=1 Tax=Streptomyces jeddahensis TaxID=1716141 RepID=A0A177HNY4_9ACTN|nr:cation-translocating P-type ATPase [Streptomyces jeddahensis]OAH12722.1 calcium-transporting ATPase 1 [Streptomyces jeddahensis]